MPGLDERTHEPEQQGEQQRPDVLAVDVGVGHQHDLVVAQLGDVEVVVHAGAERGDQRLHLVVLQHLVDAGLLDVEDLAADRQDRLEPRVAAALGRAAGGVALDDEELALLGVGRLAVGELAGQAARTRAAPCGREPGRGPCARRSGRTPRRPPCGRSPCPRPGSARTSSPSWSLTTFCTKRLRLGVAQLGLGLALELRLAQLDRDDRGEALADVLAGEVGVLLLEHAPLAGELVDQRGQRRPEALLVGAALDGVDRVGEGVDRLGEAGVPLHRDLERRCRPSVSSDSKSMTVWCDSPFFALRWRTKSTMPPS